MWTFQQVVDQQNHDEWPLQGAVERLLNSKPWRTSVVGGVDGAAAGAHLAHLLRQPLVLLQKQNVQ